MNADQHKPKSIYVTYIGTTPEKLWTALTGAEFTKQYFFGGRMESDWKVGSLWRLLMEDGRVASQGKVLECDPPLRLSISWHEEFGHLPEAIITFQIDPLGEVVRLTMTESNPEPINDKLAEGGHRSWPVILSGLKNLLETDRPPSKFDMSA